MNMVTRRVVMSVLLLASACAREGAGSMTGAVQPAAATTVQPAAAGKGNGAQAGGRTAATSASAGTTGSTSTASSTSAAGSTSTTPATSATSVPSTGGATAATSQPSAAGTTSANTSSAGAAGSGDRSAGNSAPKPAGASGPAPTEKFSFFVTSLEGMLRLSKNDQGFGGDLRYGEATGLEGADKICRELAESSMPGASAKGWHAYLSAAKAGPGGTPVHAKDRIGAGPWYDRTGRLVAMNITALLSVRPMGADPAITDDLPNENGTPNKMAMTGNMTDNHDTVTGTNQQGMWDGTMTCEDWTSVQTPMAMGAAGSSGGGRGPMFAMGGPRLGHSWPSDQSGRSWSTVHMAPGCSPSVSLVQMGGGQGTGIGNAGGYGGIYCFATTP